MKQKLSFLVILGLTANIFYGCLNLSGADKDKVAEALGLETESAGKSGTISDTELAEFAAGGTVSKDGLDLNYVQDDLYVAKSMKVTDGTTETYYTKTSSTTKLSAASVSSVDLVGTWQAYKQIQGAGTADEKVFLINLDDGGNKLLLVVTSGDDGLSWTTKLEGTPKLLTEEEYEIVVKELEEKVTDQITSELAACEREDFTAEEIALCKERIEKCKPGGEAVGTELCVVERFNPCDRPDLTEEEILACKEKVDACAPGGADYGTDVCKERFNPCDDPALTAAQREQCIFRYEHCGPGQDLYGTAQCTGAFDPCANVPEAELESCREIEQKCAAPENFEVNADFCIETLNPCNLNHLTNEEKAKCQERYETNECYLLENIEKPECQFHFDPCEGLPEEEAMECREIEARCGPANMNKTEEDIAFCDAHLNPCMDPAMTATQKRQCEEQWNMCGPNGTNPNDPRCFEIIDPCMDPFLTPEQQEQCKMDREKCRDPQTQEEKDYCMDILDPCKVPGWTSEQIKECREHHDFCAQPENMDKPECMDQHFDPCSDPNMSPEEQQKCREVEMRCGINYTPADEEFCKEALNPCNDPLLSETERLECEDWNYRCGPGGTEAGTPACLEGFDPCMDPALTPEEQEQCHMNRDVCKDPQTQEEKDFCNQQFNPCMDPNLTEEERMQCEEHQAACGPGAPEPRPDYCFEVNRDPCREGASNYEKGLCEIAMDACHSGEVLVDNEAFCAEQGEGGDPCREGASPVEMEICEYLKTTCFSGEIMDPEQEKFCHDYTGPEGNGEGGGPKPFIGAAPNLKAIIDRLGIGIYLDKFGPVEVSVAYVTAADIEVMNATGADPDFKKIIVTWDMFKDGGPNNEHIVVNIELDGKMVPFTLLASEGDDPSNPADVPGGPMIYNKGLAVLESAVLMNMK